MLQLTIGAHCIIKVPLGMDLAECLPSTHEDLLCVVDTARNVVYVFELDAPNEIFSWLRHRPSRHVAIAKEDELSSIAAAADPGGSSGV